MFAIQMFAIQIHTVMLKANVASFQDFFGAKLARLCVRQFSYAFLNFATKSFLLVLLIFEKQIFCSIWHSLFLFLFWNNSRQVLQSRKANSIVTFLKDFFWELVMLIYGNLTYLNNREISSDEILKMTSRFLTGRWF